MQRRTLIILLLITGCTALITRSEFENLYGPSVPVLREMTRAEVLKADQEKRLSYYRDIKPILDARCVVCHGCYDAPCQLNLASIDGLDRGASKEVVYDLARLKPANPSRLFTDAVTTDAWRTKGFFPVLNERRVFQTADAYVCGPSPCRFQAPRRFPCPACLETGRPRSPPRVVSGGFPG